MDSPTIVAITYDRPQSLNRLLQSIARADIAPGTRLIVSIDGGGHEDCTAIADAFDWPYGAKGVIQRDQNLGLRSHVLACGDLTAEYGPVVLLEDDTLVAPLFQQYATAVLEHYADDERIAGISLYSQRHNETARCVFEPINNGASLFMSQMPSSWGEAFTADQWRQFRDWLAEAEQTIDLDRLPLNVKSWPNSSWKRLMCAYTLETQKWFTYPYVGYSTNCAEAGVHTKRRHQTFQAELAWGASTTAFPSVEEAIKYDLWWELIEEGLEWDVYGSKHRLTGDRVLSSRRLPGYRQIQGYAMDLRPIQMNYYLENGGDDLWLNERVSGDGPVEVEPSTRVADALAEYRTDWIRSKRLLSIVASRSGGRLGSQTSRRGP